MSKTNKMFQVPSNDADQDLPRYVPIKAEPRRSYRWVWILAGASAGALAMYLLDPNRGRRRRALVRDQIYKLSHQLQHQLGKKKRNTWNHLLGFWAETTKPLHRAETYSDSDLIQKVRSAFGKGVSHGHAINVFARDGEITLRGDILRSEVKGLIATVKRVPGVRRVVNEMNMYSDTRGISSLQGEGRKIQPRHH